MEMEKEVLICYDIESNKKREKLRKELKELGFVSIQKSVMWGYVLPAEIRAAQRLLKKYVDEKGDCAFIVNTRLSEKDLYFQIGHEEMFKKYKEPYLVV
ncbi:MAG: CRISPR-associated endonuclease Cas2 [Brevinematales bacterium]|nr:CRISPR-associated endonuclease Cas2 [Brevinematales bacterium]